MFFSARTFLRYMRKTTAVISIISKHQGPGPINGPPVRPSVRSCVLLARYHIMSPRRSFMPIYTLPACLVKHNNTRLLQHGRNIGVCASYDNSASIEVASRRRCICGCCFRLLSLSPADCWKRRKRRFLVNKKQ